jgi:hypothetical protein
MGVL